MNDFTKEELENIIDGVNLLISTGSCDCEWNNKIKSLRIKLQSMIDNYCEHEYKKTLSKSGMYFIQMCHKCKHIKSTLEQLDKASCSHEWVSPVEIDEENLNVIGGVAYKCLLCNKKVIID